MKFKPNYDICVQYEVFEMFHFQPINHLWNRLISQIPQCIRQISNKTPFCNRNVHTCALWVHCGIWDWFIVGLEQQAMVSSRIIVFYNKQNSWIQQKKAGTWSCTKEKNSFIYIYIYIYPYNILRPRPNGRHFADDIFKYIFLNENFWIPVKFHWNLFLRVQLTSFQHWFR